MYLSQLSLNWRNAQARRDLSAPYEMHRTLARAFTQGEGQPLPRFLWRLEPVRLGRDPVVIIQSEQAPNFSPLEGLAGYVRSEVKSKCVDTSKLVSTGARYRFRLVANPTISREGKRRGLVGEADQVAWLRRQGDRYGFEVDSALVVTSDHIKSRKADQLITLCRVHYEGTLRVQSPDSTCRALLNGIGPGKALGCGLLSLVPI